MTDKEIIMTDEEMIEWMLYSAHHRQYCHNPSRAEIRRINRRLMWLSIRRAFGFPRKERG